MWLWLEWPPLCAVLVLIDVLVLLCLAALPPGLRRRDSRRAFLAATRIQRSFRSYRKLMYEDLEDMTISEQERLAHMKRHMEVSAARTIQRVARKRHERQLAKQAKRRREEREQWKARIRVRVFASEGSHALSCHDLTFVCCVCVLCVCVCVCVCSTGVGHEERAAERTAEHRQHRAHQSKHPASRGRRQSGVRGGFAVLSSWCGRAAHHSHHHAYSLQGRGTGTVQAGQLARGPRQGAHSDRHAQGQGCSQVHVPHLPSASVSPPLLWWRCRHGCRCRSCGHSPPSDARAQCRQQRPWPASSAAQHQLDGRGRCHRDRRGGSCSGSSGGQVDAATAGGGTA